MRLVGLIKTRNQVGAGQPIHESLAVFKDLPEKPEGYTRKELRHYYEHTSGYAMDESVFRKTLDTLVLPAFERKRSGSNLSEAVYDGADIRSIGGDVDKGLRFRDVEAKAIRAALEPYKKGTMSLEEIKTQWPKLIKALKKDQ